MSFSARIYLLSIFVSAWLPVVAKADFAGVATSDTQRTFVYYLSTTGSSRQDAEESVLTFCRSSGEEGCQLLGVVENQYIALSYSAAVRQYFVASHGNLRSARIAASNLCFNSVIARMGPRAAGDTCVVTEVWHSNEPEILWDR